MNHFPISTSRFTDKCDATFGTEKKSSVLQYAATKCNER